MVRRIQSLDKFIFEQENKVHEERITAAWEKKGDIVIKLPWDTEWTDGLEFYDKKIQDALKKFKIKEIGSEDDGDWELFILKGKFSNLEKFLNKFYDDDSGKDAGEIIEDYEDED